MSDAEFLLQDAKEKLARLSIFASRNTRKKLKKQIRTYEYDVRREQDEHAQAMSESGYMLSDLRP